ncbi:hypothetical protein EXT70_27230 [Dickeya dadantii]|nr:hypothetical protein [Dickeya dadantii]
MELHAILTPVPALQSQYWRGLSASMQLHKRRYIKRAGVAGIALRARAFRRDSSRATAPRCEVFRFDAVREIDFSLVRVERDW